MNILHLLLLSIIFDAEYITNPAPPPQRQAYNQGNKGVSCIKIQSTWHHNTSTQKHKPLAAYFSQAARDKNRFALHGCVPLLKLICLNWPTITKHCYEC